MNRDDIPPLYRWQADTLCWFETHQFERIKPEAVADLPGGAKLLLQVSAPYGFSVREVERRWTFLLDNGYVTPAELLAHARKCYQRAFEKARWRDRYDHAPEWTECPFYREWIEKCTALVNEK